MRAKTSDSAFFSFPRSVKKEVTVSSRASENTVWLGHAEIHHMTHGMHVFIPWSRGIERAYPTIDYYKTSKPTRYSSDSSYLHVVGRYPSKKDTIRFPITHFGNNENDRFPIKNVGIQ